VLRLCGGSRRASAATRCEMTPYSLPMTAATQRAISSWVSKIWPGLAEQVKLRDQSSRPAGPSTSHAETLSCSSPRRMLLSRKKRAPSRRLSSPKSLAPGNQLARAVLARSHFLQRERGAFLREMEAALRLNPGSPTYVGLAGYSLILAGDGERGRPLLEKATAMNPCHPGWYNHALYVDDYLKGDYEGALQQTLRPAFEVRLWGPLLRAAVLGQLGRAPQARAAAEELLALVPDFERRARELTHRSILSDGIVDALLDGLGKAGLQILDA